MAATPPKEPKITKDERLSTLARLIDAAKSEFLMLDMQGQYAERQMLEGTVKGEQVAFLQTKKQITAGWIAFLEEKRADAEKV